MMRRGVTLVEVLIASTMFSLVMLGSMAVWHLASGAYQEASVSAPSFRLAADGMDALSSEMRMCTAIYAPDQTTLHRGFSPTESQPLVFVENTGSTPNLVAVAQQTGGGLETWTYTPPADTWPVNPATRRSFAAGATGLTIGWTQDPGGHDFLTVSLQSGHGDALTTTVRALDAFPRTGDATP